MLPNLLVVARQGGTDTARWTVPPEIPRQQRTPGRREAAESWERERMKRTIRRIGI